MRCKTARATIEDVLDGTARESEREAFGAHVAQCRHCEERRREAEMARVALATARELAPRVPADLATRIRAGVRLSQQEAQIRDAASTPATGSPAFVATCASLVIGAVMLYTVMTQVYMKQLDARLVAGGSPIVSRTAALPESARVTFAPAGMAAPRATREAGSRVAAPAPADEDLSRPPAWTSRVVAARPPRGPVTRLASREAGREAADAERPAPSPANVRLARASSEGPADSAFAPRASQSSDAETASSRELVAGIVAQYVVEKYVTERIIESEPVLLAVTTSMPSGPATALSDGAMR